jgi:hypothetical protein
MRLALFLQILGYHNLQPLPLEQRVQMIETATSMPIWPQNGSVMIVDDTVLVKFGPYSDIQKSAICTFEDQSQFSEQDFCK